MLHEGDQWEQALALLHKMRDTGMIANVISLSVAISPCLAIEYWGQALALPHKMRDAGMAASLMSSNGRTRTRGEARKFDIVYGWQCRSEAPLKRR